MVYFLVFVFEGNDIFFIFELDFIIFCGGDSFVLRNFYVWFRYLCINIWVYSINIFIDKEEEKFVMLKIGIFFVKEDKEVFVIVFVFFVEVWDLDFVNDVSKVLGFIVGKLEKGIIIQNERRFVIKLLEDLVYFVIGGINFG